MSVDAIEVQFLSSDHHRTYLVRGHVETEKMKEAVAAYGEEELEAFSAPSHAWWRVIPNLHGFDRWYQQAEPASRGSFKCTVMTRDW